MVEGEFSVRCPVCGAAAERGKLYGSGVNSLKWLPKSRSLFLGAWAFGSTAVGRGGWGFPSSRARAEGMYCAKCNRIIIDAEEIGVGQLRFTIQHLLLTIAMIAGACTGLYTIGQHDAVAGLLCGIPCGGFLGYCLGFGLIRLLERVFTKERGRQR